MSSQKLSWSTAKSGSSPLSIRTQSTIGTNTAIDMKTAIDGKFASDPKSINDTKTTARTVTPGTTTDVKSAFDFTTYGGVFMSKSDMITYAGTHDDCPLEIVHQHHKTNGRATASTADLFRMWRENYPSLTQTERIYRMVGFDGTGDVHILLEGYPADHPTKKAGVVSGETVLAENIAAAKVAANDTVIRDVDAQTQH
ncbi:hypothetical protein GE09DRAFT_1223756 [Coniochaeta sp. 2T2.1]|nr:hypothetical protein GE09DRAFT_1223756 [Coniochaeta sp. 2T2.1]